MISVSALKGFDASQYLESIEGIKIFLTDAFETIHSISIGKAAKAFGITEIAKVTEINREKLYRAPKEKM